MDNTNQSPRIILLRDAAVFQLKLLADGIRDAILIPVSMIAALIGLLKGGQDCDESFRRAVDLGRRSERWINLFGHQDPLDDDHPVGSIDAILHQVETVVREQYRKGRSAKETRDAVRDAMKNVSDAPPDDTAGKKGQ